MVLYPFLWEGHTHEYSSFYAYGFNKGSTQNTESKVTPHILGKEQGQIKKSVPINRTVSSNWNQRVFHDMTTSTKRQNVKRKFTSDSIISMEQCFETETRQRLSLNDFPRPRRDRDFCKIVFETRVSQSIV